jgi:hypothetical protein
MEDYSMPESDERAQRLAKLSASKRALLEKWTQGKDTQVPSQIIPRRALSSPAPLSFIQEWYFYHPANEPTAVLIEGPLDSDLLERALQQLVNRHETLRTTYQMHQDVPMQHIAPSFQLHLPVESLEAWPESERFERGIQQFNAEVSTLHLDLEYGPILYTKLLRLTPQQHLLCVVVFGGIADGWAQVVFFQDLMALYEGLADGQETPLAELPIQYADFATWQRRRLQGDALEKHLAYWRERLADRPQLDLPTDFPRAAAPVYRESYVREQVPADQVAQLRAVSQAEDTTLFLTFFTVYQILLCSFTGQRDFPICIEQSSRHLRETEGLIGLFTHMLPVRVSLTDNPTFQTLLRQTRSAALDVYAHQGIPVGKLVELCDPERDLIAHPLVTATIAYLNENVLLAPQKTRRLALKPYRLGPDEEQEDLNLQIYDLARGLEVALVYHTGLFQQATIARLLKSYRQLLAAIALDPTKHCSELLQIAGGISI